MPAPFHSRLARPASAPAGGSSRTAVTPSSRRVARQESKRTGLVTWLTRRDSDLGAGVDGGAVGVGEQPPARVGRSQPADQALELLAGRGHVVGVEGAGDRQRHDPRLGRRVGLQRVQPVERAGGDDLAGAVHVRRGQAVLVDGGQDLVGVAAEDGGHAGRRLRAGGGHRPAADGGERDRGLDRQHAGERGGGELADAVPGDDDVAAGVRRWVTGPGRPPSSRAMNRLIATTSGWVTAVSLIASASPVVPRVSRSASAIAPAQRKKDSAPGRSSQSVSIPGFCAPCPGARTASTPSPCQ